MSGDASGAFQGCREGQGSDAISLCWFFLLGPAARPSPPCLPPLWSGLMVELIPEAQRQTVKGFLPSGLASPTPFSPELSRL